MCCFSDDSLGICCPRKHFPASHLPKLHEGFVCGCIRAVNLQLRIPQPPVLQERFPGPIVEFREIVLRQDSVIKKAEYRQGIAGAGQIVILTAYIFVECPYALIYVQIFFMAGLRFFVLLELSLQFRQENAAFTLQGTAYECPGNFSFGFCPILPYGFRGFCFLPYQNSDFRAIIQTEYRSAGENPKTGVPP